MKGDPMRRFARLAVVLLAAAAFALGASAWAQPQAKLPKCAQVKCRELGCPADVLCAAGAAVKTCADVCNGH
jgi:hypothetical protein